MATTLNNMMAKRYIYSNDFNESDFQDWAQDIRDANGYGDDISDDDLRQWYFEDMSENYDMERENMDINIDGVIIALGSRWSHYGAICGNGRQGTKILGSNMAGIMDFNGDSLEFWAEGYNIHGRTADHDGSWSVIYRVCKNSQEAERLQDMAYRGELTNADIISRTKSLYPYVAKVYGWPYRGYKKAS